MGGWTLSAAEQVAAGNGIEEWEVFDLLTGLADKSLVLAEERPVAYGEEFGDPAGSGQCARDHCRLV